MYTDMTGYAPEYWSNIKEWFSNRFEDVSNWLNSTYTSPFTIPSFDDVSNAVFNFMGGFVTGPALSGLTQRISQGFHIWDFEKLTRFSHKFFKVSGSLLVIVPMGLDILNTWTSNNGNTIGQRLIKSYVIFGTTAINYGAGILASKLIVAGFASSSAGVGVLFLLAGGSVMYGSILLTDHIQTEVYEYFDIK